MNKPSAVSHQRSAGPGPVNHHSPFEYADRTGGARPPDGLASSPAEETRPEAAFHPGCLGAGFALSLRRAFTLLELLAVIAVIGILAALLFPGVRSARGAAYKAKTRVQFNQWAAALEGFRSEYGYYPALHPTNLVNPPGQAVDPAALHLFHDLLAVRRRDGSALPAYTTGTDPLFPEAQNRKLVRFHAFAVSEFSSADLLADAFGNTQIAVLVDRNLDGVIRAGSDFTELPVVGGLTPGPADFPAAGVRAGVIFYAPAPGATAANPDFIFSWK